MTTISEIVLHRLRVPLTVPYKLSFVELRAFDTILVEVHGGDGRVGYGEATLLTGYTQESTARSWDLACRLCREMAGKSTGDIKRRVGEHDAQAAFTSTAITTAVEMLEANSWLRSEQRTEVPLLALLHGDTEGELADEIRICVEQGYDTFKVKVGFHADTDLARVELIQKLLAGRGHIRIDANQGYSTVDACRFASALDPQAIELLEQTCRAGDWEAAAAVAKVSTVPMMLDESIYTLEDVERAAELGAAAYIKFKLMKAGGCEKLARALDWIRELGMTPVLGNGVACDIGCWMEVRMAGELIDNAGEMNGFLKTEHPIVENPMPVESGAVVLDPDYWPRLDQAALERYAQATLRCLPHGSEET
ncbi:MAG: enolase C-terminal domain-like protein [Gammaproteobacteria bacterium]|nr:enolase C-terminal domain-like protein [Gammaproteobacteria bacterium]MDX2462232.1 enolase C-terminal domain-like protein [Gammaproteobacteria bacterium]